MEGSRGYLYLSGAFDALLEGARHDCAGTGRPWSRWAAGAMRWLVVVVVVGGLSRERCGYRGMSGRAKNRRLCL
jgi:hypothetical protein